MRIGLRFQEREGVSWSLFSRKKVDEARCPDGLDHGNGPWEEKRQGALEVRDAEDTSQLVSVPEKACGASAEVAPSRRFSPTKVVDSSFSISRAQDGGDQDAGQGLQTSPHQPFTPPSSTSQNSAFPSSQGPRHRRVLCKQLHPRPGEAL